MKLLSKNSITDAAGIAVGGVGANVIGKFVPIANPMLKNAGVLALGIVLSGKKGFIGNIGKGLVAGGASRLVGSLVPALAGDDDMSFVAEVINEIPDSTVNGTNNSVVNGIDYGSYED